MKFNLISLQIIVLIKLITTKNLKAQKQCLLPISNANSQKILVNYLCQANSNAFAMNTGVGNANAIACSVAGNSNNIVCRTLGSNGGGNGNGYSNWNANCNGN